MIEMVGDNYPWGSYVWPTLYSQLKDANVRRWPSLYATEPRRDVDKKTYSIFGFTWAFKPDAIAFGYSKLTTPVPLYPHDASLFNLNILDRARREHRPITYRQNLYMDLPPTTVLPKKQVDKTKNKGKNANLSPLNLGNAFADDNVRGDEVMITGECETSIYFTYENVELRRLPEKIIMSAWNLF
nr:hypothetical protein [Tanacetum cinerariifolium]